MLKIRCQRKCPGEKGARNRIENLKIVVYITVTGGLLGMVEQKKPVNTILCTRTKLHFQLVDTLTTWGL